MERAASIEIPPSARLVKAAGELSAYSLLDEYQPSAERRAVVTAELRELEDRERQAIIDDASVRIVG